MKKIQNILIDLVALGCLLAINPIVSNFSLSIRKATQDIILYLVMAEQEIMRGQLFLQGWEHVDKGIILPPAFPFLIAFGQLFSANSLAIAELISHLSMLLVVIFIYFCVTFLANRIVAVAAVIIVQSSYYYMSLGFWPLPEALFACLLCITILLFLKLMHAEEAPPLLSLGVGLIAAVLFFTLPVGLFVILFLIIWSAIQSLFLKKNYKKSGIKRTFFITIGFVLIAGPYLFILANQTGHSPFTKDFRLNDYAILTDDPSIVETIKNNVSEKTFAVDQNLMLRQKRMLTLLDDGSEMLQYVIVPASLTQGINKETRTPFVEACRQNLASFLAPLGGVLAWLFFISLITPLVIAAKPQTRSLRLFLPFLILSYLIGKSYSGSTVDRQMILLYPLVIMQIATEAYHAANMVRGLIPETKKYIACCVIASLGCLLLAYAFPPKLYRQFTFPTQKNTPVIKKTTVPEIKNREPVFAVNPLGAFRTGFSFRTLPNDSLEKITAYGKATGVRFLLYDWKDPNNLLYDKAKWMRGPGFVRSEYVKSNFRKGSLTLYELQEPDKK